MWPKADGVLALGDKRPGAGRFTTGRSVMPLPGQMPHQRNKPMPPPFRIPAPQPTPSRLHLSLLLCLVMPQQEQTLSRLGTRCSLWPTTAQQGRTLSVQHKTLLPHSVMRRQVMMRPVRRKTLQQVFQSRPQVQTPTNRHLATLPLFMKLPRDPMQSRQAVSCQRRLVTQQLAQTVFRQTKHSSHLLVHRRLVQIKFGPIRRFQWRLATRLQGLMRSLPGHFGYR